jgi:hypothetical protein
VTVETEYSKGGTVDVVVVAVVVVVVVVASVEVVAGTVVELVVEALVVVAGRLVVSDVVVNEVVVNEDEVVDVAPAPAEAQPARSAATARTTPPARLGRGAGTERQPTICLGARLLGQFAIRQRLGGAERKPGLRTPFYLRRLAA